MKLIVYTGEDLRRIEGRAGSDERSERLLIEAFLPVLSRIGKTYSVDHLDEVEPIRAECESAGESCVILSFVPPHKTTLFMRVGLIPVFAWGSETIPYETWDGQPKHDWRMVLQQQGRAITMSSHSAAVVRDTMGESFPVVGIQPPVFDRMAKLRERIGGRLPSRTTVTLPGSILDWDTLARTPKPSPRSSARTTDQTLAVVDAAPTATASTETAPESGIFHRVVKAWGYRIKPRLRRSTQPSWTIPIAHADAVHVTTADLVSTVPQTFESAVPRGYGELVVSLDGVVFLARLTSPDGSNFDDLLTSFAIGLGNAVDATLVIEVPESELADYRDDAVVTLKKLPPFACRIVLVVASDDDALNRILEAASYVVNCASGDGCGFSLLQGMSVGRPAISPDHTAMSDFIDSSNSLVIRSHPRATMFGHDGRGSRRTMWHIPQWDSLRDGFRDGYHIATHDYGRWLAMSRSAIETQRRRCGDELVEGRLRNMLGVSQGEPSLSRWGRDLRSIPVAADTYETEDLPG